MGSPYSGGVLSGRRRMLRLWTAVMFACTTAAPLTGPGAGSLGPTGELQPLVLAAAMDPANTFTAAQLAASEKLMQLLEPLGRDMEDRLARVAWLEAQADAPLRDESDRLKEKTSNTTARHASTLQTLATIPTEMETIRSLIADAEVIMKNAQSEQARLKIECDAHLASIERRLTKLREDKDVLAQLTAWLDGVGSEWGAEQVLAQLRAMTSELDMDDLDASQLHSLSSSSDELAGTDHAVVVKRVVNSTDRVREVIGGLQESYSKTVSNCSTGNRELSEKISKSQATLAEADHKAESLTKEKERLTEKEQADAVALEKLQQQHVDLEAQRQTLSQRWDAEKFQLEDIRSTQAALVDALGQIA